MVNFKLKNKNSKRNASGEGSEDSKSGKPPRGKRRQRKRGGRNKKPQGGGGAGEKWEIRVGFYVIHDKIVSGGGVSKLSLPNLNFAANEDFTLNSGPSWMMKIYTFVRF